MARGPREYEVEHIVKAKVSYKRKRTIHWNYWVKWKGYNEKDNTWEPEISFETSPGLIKSFWKKADTKGRDRTSAKLFQAREEINLHEGVSMSDSDADGEDDDQEEESASPKTPKARGRKRPGPAIAADGTAPKRKRGKHSKANTKAEEQTKGDGKDNSESLGEDKDDVSSKRNSRRLSEQTHENMSSEGRVNELLHQSQSSPHSFSKDKRIPTNYISSENASEGSEAEELAATAPFIPSKRKAYIESDDEEEVDSIVQGDPESSSHDGSLFSGDEDEDEDERNKTNGEIKYSAKGLSPSIVLKPAPNPLPESLKARNPVQMPLPTTSLRRGRPARPRVMMIDDPSIKEALEKRVHNRTHGPPGKTADDSGQNRGESSSNVADGRETAGERQAGPSAISPLSPGSGRKDGGTYRPTLLTFEKGKLTSQRRKGVPDPVQQLPKFSSNMRANSEEEPIRHIERQSPENDGPSAMDTTEDFGTSVDMLDNVSKVVPETTSLEAPVNPSESESVEVITTTTETRTVVSIEEEVKYTGPPPTADELLRLSGRRDTLDDLPDFPPDEVSAVEDVVMTTAEAASSLLQVAGVEETPGAGAWKQSDIFNTPTPLASLKSHLAKSSNTSTPPVTSRAIIPLHLGGSHVVCVELKDMVPAHGSIGLFNLTETEPSALLPGKLYSLAVLNHVQPDGASARVVLTEDMSDQQRLWFASLQSALEKDHVFLIRISGTDIALCSSSNREAAHQLKLPSALIGLSKSVIIQCITVTDAAGLEHHSREARSLSLR